MITSKIQEYCIPLKFEISSIKHIFLKTFNSEFQEIRVWFTDQNSRPLEIEDRINLTMLIK